MNKKILKAGISLGAILISASSFADEAISSDITPIQNMPVFTFSSFGTIGAVQTNTDNGIFTTGRQAEGATKTADFAPDTKVGAQIDSKFNDFFSATLQVFSKENTVSSYEPGVEWAFAKLKIGGGFDLRLGRIGAPFFMASDFRNVGYTNISVRTPTDVYGLVPVRTFDGGDLLYNTNIGNTTINGQMWLGTSRALLGASAAGDEYITLNNIAGLNISAENGPLTVRAGTMKTRLSTSGSGLAPFNTLLSTLTKVSAYPGLGELATMSDDLAINGKFASFTDLGAVLDLSDWVLSGEYVQRNSGSTYVASATAWYATLGYRISTFTPYVSFSNRKTNSTTSYAELSVAPALGAKIAATVPVLVNGVNSALTNSNESTSALGVRWDAGKNYDIKAEFQQLRIPAGSAGIFSDVQGGFYSVDTRVNAVSLVVDFVY